jgi:hypothetical protein
MKEPTEKEREDALGQLEELATQGEIRCLLDGWLTNEQIKQLAEDYNEGRED